MPASTLSAERLRSLVGVPYSEAQLEELLFASKAELESREGDELHLSVTPDRLDLLSEAGLGLHLAGTIGAASGLVRPPERPPSDRSRILVDPSVSPLRPWLAAVTVESPTPAGLDEGTLAEAIRFQELLHATIGRDRRAASLGIYPLERVELPVRYALEPVTGVRFVPLDGAEEVTAERFFRDHPMAQKYAALGRVDDRCLTLRDARDSVLSLPPILNSRAAGEARPGDRALLLESTGRSERAVREAVGLLQLVFVARGYSVGAVAVEGPSPSDGTGFFRPRSVELPASVLRGISGEGSSVSEVERRLAACRLSGHPQPGGWRVEVPPWRPDLLTAVDVAEDVVLAGGVLPESGLLPPSSTRGRRRAETLFRTRLRRLFLGYGLAQPYTTLLVGDRTVRLAGATGAVPLQNPVSAEYSHLRDRLLLSHLEVLGRNTRHPYPQRFGEVAPVLRRSERSEAGAETRSHAGAVLAGEGLGFADGAALVEYVLRTLDVAFVREPAPTPATIPGRGAVFRSAGEPVAEVGELHPAVLEALGVPVPAVWAELDLAALWPLVRRRDTP